MRFARVNGIVLHHEVAGPRDAPAVVFSNALGTDFRIWDAVATDLENDYRLIRYDKRGHGLSEAQAAPYALADHVADLAGLLDHLGVSGATIVGLSVGGMIAQGLAAHRPDVVRALVLCDTAYKIGTHESWDERIEIARREGIGALADGVLQRWFTPAFRSPDNPDFQGCRAMLTRTPVEGYAGTCATVRDTDLTETARALSVPTLCLVGDQDGSTPPDLVRTLAGLIGGARLEVIADAGHLPCIEQPQTVARHIRLFLGSLQTT